MDNKILFSIIISTYNDLENLKKTVKNLDKNLNKNFEIIIIDGNSGDKTKDFLKTNSHKLRWISESDTGIYNAWNKGLKMINGDWIMFLGAGDKIKKDLLSRYYELILEDNTLDFLFCNINIGSKEINSRWNWKTFRKYMNIPHCGGLHNKKYFENFGAFNEEFKIAGDYEILLRSKGKIRVKKLNYLGVEMDENGISQKNINVFKEARKAKILNESQKLIPSYLFYITSIIKHETKRFFLQ